MDLHSRSTYLTLTQSSAELKGLNKLGAAGTHQQSPHLSEQSPISQVATQRVVSTALREVIFQEEKWWKSKSLNKDNLRELQDAHWRKGKGQVNPRQAI